MNVEIKNKHITIFSNITGGTLFSLKNNPSHYYIKAKLPFVDVVDSNRKILNATNINDGSFVFFDETADCIYFPKAKIIIEED